MAKYTSNTATAGVFGSGNDTFTGSLGNDIVVFNDNLQDYIVDFTNNQLTIYDTKTDTVSGDGDGYDSLSGIEKLIFKGDNKQLLMSQEAVVNINTTGEQTQTAMLATNDGGFYSFWASGANQEVKKEGDDDGSGYYYRTFNTDGAGSADVRLLKGSVNSVSQAVFSDNSFVLVWSESDAGGMGVFVQVFNADGTTKIEKYRVNDTITDNQVLPSVAVTNNGSDTGFVVAWQSNNQGDSIHNGAPMGDTPNSAGVFVQTFDLNGNPLGYEEKVGDSGGGSPSVSALSNGGFVVAYEAVATEGGRMQVLSSIFNADGVETDLTQFGSINTYDLTGATQTDGALDNSLITEMSYINPSAIHIDDIEASSGKPLNELRTETKEPKVVQLTGGDIVYVWQSPVDGYLTVDGSVDYDRSIIYNIYTKNTGDLRANEIDYFYNNTAYVGQMYEQSQPEVAALSGGGFVIVWQSMLHDNSYWGVYARMFDSDGTPNGSEFLVNTKTADSQKNPNVVALSNGGFVISWEGEYQDGNQQGLFQEGTGKTEIVMQRYDSSGNKLGSSFAGTAASDTLNISGTDAVELDGAAGNDTLTTSSGDDTIRGGLGDDSISGGAGNDVLIGGDGNDTITGSVGNDIVFGGDGSDRFVLTGLYDDYTIIGGNGTYTITDERVSGVVDGVDVVSGIEVLSFVDQDFSIGSSTSGGTTGVLVEGDIALADTLNGGDNDDTLRGGGNNSGVEIDTLQGGNGDDTYIVTGTAAVIFDTAGTDTLQISTTIDLSKQTIGKLDGWQYIENVILLGAKSLKITGNSTNNELTGNNGANNIKGGTGDDTLNGGLGKDVLAGGAGDDVFIFDSTPSKANVDKIIDFGNGSDSIQLADAFFSGLDPDGDGAITYIEGSGLKAAANNLVSYIVYDTKGGGIYYDAAGAKSILIATLGKVGGHIPDMDPSDFSLI